MLGFAWKGRLEYFAGLKGRTSFLLTCMTGSYKSLDTINEQLTKHNLKGSRTGIFLNHW
jgi:hypothetical protein